MTNSEKDSVVQMFDATALGKSLKETTVRTVKTHIQDIITVWCHSHHGIDLYYWKDERNNIIKQQMQFHGQIAEWNVIEGTRTGVVIEDEQSAQASSHIAYDELAMSLTIEQIVRILNAAVSLKENERQSLIRNFTQSRHFGTLSTEEVLSLYGRPKTVLNLFSAWWDRIIYTGWFRLESYIRLSKKPRR